MDSSLAPSSGWVTFGLRPGALVPGLSLPEVVLVLSLRLAPAVFWTPYSILFAWMSTVATCGLASSSSASSLLV